LSPNTGTVAAEAPAPAAPPVDAAREENARIEVSVESSLPLTDALYFSAEQLTAKPVFLSNGGGDDSTFIPDIYPLPVVVHLFISEQGNIDKVVLEESFLSDTAKNFIVDSFTPMKFSPGMLGNFAVKSQLMIEVKLNPSLPGH
jgi:hypothetical protein